jgi:hypothetical protein
MAVYGGKETTSAFPTIASPIYYQHYHQSAVFRMATLEAQNALGVGSVPTYSGEWVINDDYDFLGRSTVKYEVEYDADDAGWAGTYATQVHDGDAITDLYRYWRVKVTLTTNYNDTPTVSEINARFSQFVTFAMAGEGFDGYSPIVDKVEGSIDESSCR